MCDIAMRLGKFVITGAPCTGKTTVINELSKRGYYTVAEPSRLILENHPEFRASVASNEDVDKLQRMILKLQLETELMLPRDRVVFMDGGIPSDIAFYKVRGMAPAKELIEASKKTKYDAIFILDHIKTYEIDSLRQQTERESKRIHRLLYEAYSDLGYDLIRVPLLAPTERAGFIEKVIDSL
jgi:predicted ATPase